MFGAITERLCFSGLLGGQWASYLLHKIGQCILLGLSTLLSIMCYTIQSSLIVNIY